MMCGKTFIASLAGLIVSACGSSSSSNGADDSSRLAGFQTAAKEQVQGILKDPDSAKYEDVHAYKHVNDTGQTAYVFCGKVNSKNGFGGYGGYQRFVSTVGIAVLEEQASDFRQVWSQFCNGEEETIWW